MDEETEDDQCADTEKVEICEMCWRRPRATPFIYIEEEFEGKKLFRYLCFECSIEITKNIS